jgi:PilZ domain
MMMEKRKSPRQRSFLRGFVRLADQNYSQSCIVRDVSEAGAKLRFKHRTSFTGNVELHIPEKQKIIQASVVWVDNCEVGVSFHAPVAIADPIPADSASTDVELSDRVARLETEITALKQMLSHLQEHRDNKPKVA